jgi:hypothetical protein
MPEARKARGTGFSQKSRMFHTLELFGVPRFRPYSCLLLPVAGL